MDLTQTIALWGAVTGTLALGWAAYTWISSSWTRVKLLTRQTATGPDEDDLVGVLEVTVLNRSKFPIRVTSVFINQKEARYYGSVGPLNDENRTVPGLIEPYRGGNADFLWEELDRYFDVKRPLRITVHLDTQKKFVFERYV